MTDGPREWTIEDKARHLWWLASEWRAAQVTGDADREREVVEAIALSGAVAGQLAIRTAARRLIGEERYEAESRRLAALDGLDE